MREGGLKILRGGGAHFFPTLKRGAQVFFLELNIKYFLKRYAISEIGVQAVLLSNCLFLFQIRTCRDFV